MASKQLGIYQVKDQNGELMYIGSTALSLDRLEYNHRNAMSLNYSMTRFRRALIQTGQMWQFSWLERPRNIDRFHAEIIEGALIRVLQPRYNYSRYPYERSVHEQRCQDYFNDVKEPA